MSKYIYLAGLLDGEGTIGICRDNSRKTRAPYVSVTSTTPEIIQYLKDHFGGVVCVQKVYQSHHKPSWSWRLRKKQDVFDLIRLVEPHMIEPSKKKRINLLLTEYDKVTPRNGKYTDELLEEKQKFERKFLATK